MLRITNPATEEMVAELRNDTEANIEAKMDIAKSAQIEWKATSFAHRKQLVLEFATLLKSNIEDCAKVLTSEMGKPITQSRGEIGAVEDRINFFIREAEDLLNPEIVLDEKGMTIDQQFLQRNRALLSRHR